MLFMLFKFKYKTGVCYSCYSSLNIDDGVAGRAGLIIPLPVPLSVADGVKPGDAKTTEKQKKVFTQRVLAVTKKHTSASWWRYSKGQMNMLQITCFSDPSSRHSVMTFPWYGVFREFPQDSSTAVGLTEPTTRGSGLSRFTLPTGETGWDRARLPVDLGCALNQTGSAQRTCAVLLHIVDWDWLNGHQVLGLCVWNHTLTFRKYSSLSLRQQEAGDLGLGLGSSPKGQRSCVKHPEPVLRVLVDLHWEVFVEVAAGLCSVNLMMSSGTPLARCPPQRDRKQTHTCERLENMWFSCFSRLFFLFICFSSRPFCFSSNWFLFCFPSCFSESLKCYVPIKTVLLFFTRRHVVCV